MIFLPLPFVVALLLLILLVAMLRNEPHKGLRPFLVLLCLCSVQSIIVGLRWGYDITALRYVLPLLASCLPPLVLASFRCLIHGEEAGARGARWLHAAPPLGMIALMLLAPALVDGALIVLFVGYALALLNLGRTGPDALDEARLDGAQQAHRALLVAAAALCVSALFDLAIFLDFQWAKGANAALIVSNASLLELLFLGFTADVAARARPLPALPAKSDNTASLAAKDREVLDRVDHLLTEQRLSRDENLTLSRLARRAGVPARQISGAVNRLAQKNVSQYINDFRIAEACRMLRETDMSVTAAMLESGFQTKSNFNREFRRVTCLSPASWRERNRPSSS
ncbi:MULTISPECIES: helix-turn-helix domain-containing protein [Sinorhizobium]|uniref:AraC family transcriptional regulator n=2 Tax=Sinorhizobium TaxID=28105 RepID=A0A2S3YTH7_9HYPH|nr:MULTISPECIES: AraC family transcriptional regulator [Sinorhizobium]ASY60374.1 Transcriptional regulator, AraC family [Sinorhizobium sp. CCBAU 05631]AUX80560.1 AraC family transcriptional regulator protein [Sinorhizobium fredii]PDT37536.1 AraC family transcriptional regulator [Sinorhizobium sp. FG01]PDT51436.1 AraC family transcriptional regulator [Sinorhizobium sp. NG07B]POH26088.1 AraC family transcriptional regulator [Sinorhizobium americanum]